MAQFLKTLRRLPVKEDLKDIATFINRELLPFIGELGTSTDTTEENNDTIFDSLIEPEYIVKSANSTLTNERVADDSTEIDLDYSSAGIVSWFLKTASVAFSKLSDLSGLSVLGRATNSSGVMAAITATAGSQRLESNALGTSIGWVSSLSSQFDDTVSGTLDPYLLPSTFKSGDSLVWVITGNVTLNRIKLSDGSIPPDGMVLYLSLRDQSGGAAPGFSITIPDLGSSFTDACFRTPGQVQGTSPGPSYVMQSEEEGCICIIRAGNWRLLGGTAAQALTGDITVSSGNGSTRDAQITTNVILNADINTNAGIVLSKLAVQNANTAVVNATAGSAVPTALAVGTNTVLGRVAGNIVAASLVGAQMTDAIVTPAKLAIIASNIAASFRIFISATSGGTAGIADDVTIYNASAPFAFRITDVRPIISTAVALSTVELRTATGGGGSLLSSSFTSATAGEAAITASWTATSTVAANGSIFLRRSDRSVVLELIIECIRT